MSLLKHNNDNKNKNTHPSIRDRQRQKQRQRDRETERDTQRQRQRQRDTERVSLPLRFRFLSFVSRRTSRNSRVLCLSMSVRYPLSHRSFLMHVTSRLASTHNSRARKAPWEVRREGRGTSRGETFSQSATLDFRAELST